MSDDISYLPKFEEGDEIFMDGRYMTILDLEDGQYYVARKGRFRWVDASEIDSLAEPRERNDE